MGKRRTFDIGVREVSHRKGEDHILDCRHIVIGGSWSVIDRSHIDRESLGSGVGLAIIHPEGKGGIRGTIAMQIGLELEAANLSQGVLGGRVDFTFTAVQRSVTITVKPEGTFGCLIYFNFEERVSVYIRVVKIKGIEGPCAIFVHGNRWRRSHGGRVVHCEEINIHSIGGIRVIRSIVDAEVNGRKRTIVGVEITQQLQLGEIGGQHFITVLNLNFTVVEKTVTIIVHPESSSGGGLKFDFGKCRTFHIYEWELSNTKCVSDIFRTGYSKVSGSRVIIHRRDIYCDGVASDGRMHHSQSASHDIAICVSKESDLVNVRSEDDFVGANCRFPIVQSTRGISIHPEQALTHGLELQVVNRCILYIGVGKVG